MMGSVKQARATEYNTHVNSTIRTKSLQATTFQVQNSQLNALFHPTCTSNKMAYADKEIRIKIQNETGQTVCDRRLAELQ